MIGIKIGRKVVYLVLMMTLMGRQESDVPNTEADWKTKIRTSIWIINAAAIIDQGLVNAMKTCFGNS